MATQMDIAEARGRMDELLARARSGEEIVLAEDDKPVVRISPAAGNSGARVFGEFAGKVHLSDDFAAPLAGDELAEWEK
jgi:antitoxin (DNA-binding transcriptional repressor) of toxin-antitoxin stability system